MSDIKMSSWFDLPFTAEPSGVISDNYCIATAEFCGTFSQSKAAVHAINSHDALVEQNKALRESLAYAIKEADGWHDDCRGGVLDGEEMTKARALLEQAQ